MTIFICLLAATTGLCGSPEQTRSVAPRPAHTVEEDYAAFKDALLDSDGAEAVRYVTEETIAFYDRCRKMALDSEGVDFASLGQMEVVLTFQLRYLLNAASLREMDGRSLFAWAVRNGLVKKETLKGIELNGVQHEGETAIATLSKDGQPVNDLVFHFERRDGVWRLDLMRITKLTGEALDEIRRKAGKSKIEMAVYLLERTYDTQIPPQILEGPLK